MSREFINNSQFEFTDISNEQYRIYEYSNGKMIFIAEPLKLNIAKSGGHRIYDRSGVCRYIPQGWVQLIWQAKTDQPDYK